MKTIKFQVFFIVLSGIIMASAIIGGFGIFWSNTAVKKSSAQILDLMAQTQTEGLNAMFSDIEQSSKVLSYYVSDNLNDLGILREKERLSKYIARLEDIAFYISNCTEPALAVYVRFAPELTDGVTSILWRKKDGEFIQDSLNDFPFYESSVDNSWYYMARQLEKGFWTRPYYNDDFNEYVISYGLPVYKDGKFFAVVGMDIDFDDIASLVNSITIYDTGYAFLTDEDFEIVYHRSIPAGTHLFGTNKNFKLISHKEINSEFYEYKNKKTTYRMLYKNLHNGMRLVVSVPASEIDRDRTRLIYSLIISVLAISLIVSLWSVWVSGRFTRPLKKLSVCSRNIIAGNYDVDFDFRSSDEVGELIGNFSFMAKSLKRQFDYINGLAYLDAMTGAKNKRSFIDARDELNSKIQASKKNGEKFDFGVIVFDVNDLKPMNDNFGHKAGDLLIKCSCNLIMKNFTFSTVYRIGGDEFVVILKGRDFENRAELLTKLRMEMDVPVAEKNEAFEKISLASGMAIYEPQKDADFQSVFGRADEEMYKAKVAMKGGPEKVRS